VAKAVKSSAKLSEVLRHAQTLLIEGLATSPWMGDLRQYSCDAVYEAIKDLHPRGTLEEHQQVQDFYREGALEMGVDLTETYVFEDCPAEERQGARYMWLDLAALMAEEQGV